MPTPPKPPSRAPAKTVLNQVVRSAIVPYGHHDQRPLFPVKEAEFDGVAMGVLSDGTPYLHLRGLARLCGVDHAPLSRLASNWDDITPASGAEWLGYPTQKPLALLERIIAVASNEGDVVLDPFCGCGTAVHAAEKLGRHWIGIDITNLAISLIEKRLRDAFPAISFDVHGVPKDIEGARDLALRDKYQFQWWACSLVNAQPFGGKKKGADGGIDGLIFFQDQVKGHKKIIVSVKGGAVNVTMVRELAQVVNREKADIGLFVSLIQPTKPMTVEAVKEGYYTSPDTGKAFPKLQILTIEGLLHGKERALYPDLSQGSTTFKKAKIEEKSANQDKLF